MSTLSFRFTDFARFYASAQLDSLFFPVKGAPIAHSSLRDVTMNLPLMIDLENLYRAIILDFDDNTCLSVEDIVAVYAFGVSVGESITTAEIPRGFLYGSLRPQKKVVEVVSGYADFVVVMQSGTIVDLQRHSFDPYQTETMDGLTTAFGGINIMHIPEHILTWNQSTEEITNTFSSRVLLFGKLGVEVPSGTNSRNIHWERNSRLNGRIF